MLPDREEVRASGVIISRLWFWIIILMVTLGAITAVTLYTKPFWLGLERKAYVSSHQYVEARRTELLQLKTQIDGIDVSLSGSQISDNLKGTLKSQRAGLVQRMRTAAAEIPPDAVPPAVTQFLARN